MKRDQPIVAIDGPAGAGKSTVSRRLAQALGLVLLDTGALYRGVALAASRRGVALGDETAVGALAHELARARAFSFALAPAGGQRLLLAGEDVSEEIRTPAMSMGASRVSAYAGVRQALLEVQRGFGAAGGVVAEGRDIGTVVFPDAEVKFFLTASVEVRARRRQDELEARGAAPPFEETLAEQVVRDRQDSERPIAPLRRAPDARLIDSTGRSIDDVVDEMREAVARVVQGI